MHANTEEYLCTVCWRCPCKDECSSTSRQTADFNRRSMGLHLIKIMMDANESDKINKVDICDLCFLVKI